MSPRDPPRGLIRATLVLVAVLCIAAVTSLPAQQAPDSARVVPASSVQASSPSAAELGPRVAPRFHSVVPSLERSDASRGSALAPQDGGHSTIVISTLGLVLILVIVVLLLR